MNRSIWMFVAVLACFLSFMTLHAEESVHSIIYHTPKDYMEMIKKSDVTYTIDKDKNLKPTDLAADKTSVRLFPFVYLEKNKDGTAELRVQEPQGESSRLLDEAMKNSDKGEYAKAIELGKQAVRAKPPYPKAWTYLGLVYHLSGDNVEAEKAFKKAIQLNDVDYQAYAGLAETYSAMGKNKEALDQITQAYVLAKDNPHVLQSLQGILKKNNLKVREGRLSVPFAVRKVNDEKCDIVYRDTDSLRWMPMANCLAVWQMEPQLNKRIASGNLSEIMRMYGDCVLNQMIIASAKAKDGKALSDKERWLEKVMDSGDLNWLILWELTLSHDPAATALQPKKDRDAIARYIKKFVYQKR